MINVSYIAKLTIAKMKPATKALFLALWRDGVARVQQYGGRPLVGQYGTEQHEELADYVWRLADYVLKGESPAQAVATTRRPSLSPYIHTPTVNDLDIIRREDKNEHQ